jgi:hypothetical protein
LILSTSIRHSVSTCVVISLVKFAVSIPRDDLLSVPNLNI